MTDNKIILEDLERITNHKLNWIALSGKTILITGANGFLPAYLVETILYLLHKGIIVDTKVIALVRNEEKAKKRFHSYLDNKNLSFIIQDVCEPLNIKTKVNYIIHAASQASPIYYGVDPVGTLSANVLGTINLLKFAQTQELDSFLFFSSSEVYGIVNNENTQIQESDYGYLDPTNVRTCYAEGKRMGETICISWYHQYNIPVKIVRPFHTYGPGMGLNDGRVFADFVADIVKNRDIIMKSDGSARRAFCYLSDATVAFFLLLLEGKNGESYNMGNPNCEVSILELAQILVSLFPEKDLQVIKQETRNDNYIKSAVQNVNPDVSKIKALGWKPVVSIEQGFKRSVESYA